MKPLLVVILLFNALVWANYLTGHGEKEQTLRPMHTWAMAVTLLAARFCCNRYSPQAWILCPAYTLIQIQLAIRDQIPGQNTMQMRTDYEYMWVFILVFAFICNYNTFKTTVLTLPLIHLTSYYF